MKLYYRVIAILFCTLPIVAGAVTTVRNFGDLIVKVGQYLSAIIPLLFGLGVVVFVWGLVTALWKGREKDDARANGWSYAWFGIGMIFIAVSFGGIVWFFNRSVGIDQNEALQPPCIRINPTDRCP